MPWKCGVLGIDTARRSGWCLSLSGKRVDSGEVDTEDEAALRRVVAYCVAHAEAAELVLVLVLEAPWGGNVDVVAALGAVRERWRAAWKRAGQAKARIVLVKPVTWRCAVLGRASVGMRREEVRALEQRIARAVVGKVCGPDEAPAVLIARWAERAAVVGKASGKRVQKRSLREWTSNS